MEYNTSRKKLAMPEYGRHVHMMVQHVAQIKDREERNTAARAIINIMGNLQSHLRDIPDFRHKLWDHLFIISDFKLDIDSPYPIPSIEKLAERPATVPYQQAHINKKHYGKVIVEMIREAAKMEDSELKNSLVRMLANQMKKSYAAWNRIEVTNEQIIQDLWDISDGKIVLNPDLIQLSDPVFDQYSQSSKPRRKKMAGSGRK